ncbi:MAG: DUF4126 domain-containing protein [Porphyrobacter sp.]|nr:DUF4126 domain-containing protein [Porphyrobacter sp.]
MLQPILMGLVGGQRAMTPLAAVTLAAARGELPHSSAAPHWLGNRALAGTALALAVGEMAGDKRASTPDRIEPAGLAVRFVTSALAGAALAPRGRRNAAAMIAGTAAIGAAWLGWRARKAAMRRHGLVATGFAEDAATLATTAAGIRMARW